MGKYSGLEEDLGRVDQHAYRNKLFSDTQTKI